MSAHTPGPWTVEQLVESLVRVRDSQGDIVSLMACDGDDAEACAAQKADANLIAAAPDLLEEMEKQAHSLTVLKLQKFKDPDVRALLEEMHAGARAAISKARGK